jgi:hypothetical protein
MYSSLTIFLSVIVGVTYKVRGKGNDLNIDLSFDFLADDTLFKML